MKNISFEEKVLKNLADLGIRPAEGLSLRLGVAVSGGADSVSLLYALSSIFKPLGLPLFVINVNHNIRDEAESAGDSFFARDLCEKLRGQGAEHEDPVDVRVKVQFRQSFEKMMRVHVSGKDLADHPDPGSFTALYSAPFIAQVVGAFADPEDREGGDDPLFFQQECLLFRQFRQRGCHRRSFQQ